MYKQLYDKSLNMKSPSVELKQDEGQINGKSVNRRTVIFINNLFVFFFNRTYLH